MKLDIGCGYYKEKGYVSVDNDPDANPDILHDMTKIPYPIKTDSVESIWCSHALENAIQNRQDLTKIIKEWYRISKPGAEWIITLPHWTRFPATQHIIGFKADWIDHFSGKFRGTADHYTNFDIELKKVTYNWRRGLQWGGGGKLLRLIRWLWNPVINLNLNLTEDLLCYKFGGIEEWTFYVKIGLKR